ncbi:MAG TPA: YihY/virulence factor BrkB family protein [Trueperaceae bacterium]|nr:YihY/virulence factor BrkB family protein [Trueperaceae bacterium]
MWATIKEAVKGFGQHKVPRSAAALSYYTLFSLAPLLVIIIAVVGLIYGSEEARSQLVTQLQNVVGPDAAGLVRTIIERTQQTGSGVVATIIGVATLLLGATGAFVQLQRALNEIWEVPRGAKRGVMRTVMMRLKGLLMVLAMGLAALLAVALQGVLRGVSSNFDDLLPGADWLWFVANLLLNLGIFTLVFAALFKLVPDAEMGWGEVWRGAFFTGVLFLIGQLALGYYLTTAGVSSTYGAAGTLVILALFVYYSAQIMLFGAQFTRVDTLGSRRRRGQSERFARKP